MTPDALRELATRELVKGALAAHLDISEELLVDLEACGNLDATVTAILSALRHTGPSYEQAREQAARIAEGAFLPVGQGLGQRETEAGNLRSCGIAYAIRAMQPGESK